MLFRYWAILRRFTMLFRWARSLSPFGGVPSSPVGRGEVWSLPAGRPSFVLACARCIQSLARAFDLCIRLHAQAFAPGYVRRGITGSREAPSRQVRRSALSLPHLSARTPGLLPARIIAGTILTPAAARASGTYVLETTSVSDRREGVPCFAAG